MRCARLAPLGIALLLGACASQGGTQSGTASPRRNPYVITSEELQQAATQGITNLYDLISRTHSTWLVSRTRASVQVWLDNQRMGSVSYLRNVSLSLVTQARYLSPSEAQGQLGQDNTGGAIVLTSAR